MRCCSSSPLRVWLCNGFAIGALVFFSVATIIYKRWVFSPRAEDFTHPLLVAAIAKLGQALIYFLLAAKRWNRARRQRAQPPKRLRWLRWCPYIALSVLFAAASLGGDTVVYRYLDLTTKQIIDATMPVVTECFAMLATLIACAYASICLCSRSPYQPLSPNELEEGQMTTMKETTEEQEEEMAEAEEEGERADLLASLPIPCRYRWLRRGALCGVVLGTALIAWHVATEPEQAERHGTPWRGVVIDLCTVVTSACGVLLGEWILRSAEWTPFRLTAVNAIPEFLLLFAAACILDGDQQPSLRGPLRWTGALMRDAAIYAAPLAVVAAPLALLSTTILSRTSAVTMTVLGNAIMGIVIVIDFIAYEKHARISAGVSLGLIACVLSTATFSYLEFYIGKRRQRVLKAAAQEDGVPLHSVTGEASWVVWESADQFSSPAAAAAAAAAPVHVSYVSSSSSFASAHSSASLKSIKNTV